MDNADGVAVAAATAVLAGVILAAATGAWNNPTLLVWYALALLVFGGVMALEAIHGDPTGAET